MSDKNLKRTSKEIWFLDLALRCSKQGTCLRRNYGAIVVDVNNNVVSTGYTGSPAKQNHCSTCWRQEHKIPSGCNYEKCRSVHAEMNSIIQAGKEANGCVLYLAGYDVETGKELFNRKPCYLCIKMLVNAGVKSVIFKKNEEEICIVSTNSLFIEIENETFL